MADPNELSRRLRNVGPTLATRMIASGIDTPEKLRELGAKRAYAVMYAHGDRYGDFNAAYLYALEGAIRDRDWSELPASVRDELKAHAQALQRAKKDDA